MSYKSHDAHARHRQRDQGHPERHPAGLREIAENLSGIEELTYKVDALSDAMGEFNNELD